MIAELLLTGEENPTTAKDLCKMTGFKHRDLTQLIEKERREGQPICASCDSTKPGYYLAKDRQEMKAYCGRLSHRLGEIAATLRGCKRSMEQLAEGGAEDGN